MNYEDLMNDNKNNTSISNQIEKFFDDNKNVENHKENDDTMQTESEMININNTNENHNQKVENLEKKPDEIKEEKISEKIVISENDRQKFENSNSYNVKLENFEGPLDLLLYLIKDSKVEIEDIKLAEVTEQYLSYMKDLDNVDMEKAAEFIEIAATLLEIKSKYLLPQENMGEIDIDDPEQRLLMRLKEYKLFKEAGLKLKEQENVDRLYKMPDEKVNDFRIVLKQMNLDNLISAFTNLLSRSNIEKATEETKTIERDRWTVEEKEFEIKTLIMQKGELKFSEIVSSDFTRGEIITTFMALLELLKRQQIYVSQEQQFGEITIMKGENLE